jgi:hypothetical protein
MGSMPFLPSLRIARGGERPSRRNGAANSNLGSVKRRKPSSSKNPRVEQMREVLFGMLEWELETLR